MNKTEKTERFCAYTLIAFLSTIFIIICIQIVVKNVLYEKMKINNSFVTFFMKNDYVLQKDKASASIDLQKVYPFKKDSYQGIRDEKAYHDDSLKVNRIDKYKNSVELIKKKLDRYTNELFILLEPARSTDEKLKAIINWKLRDWTNEEDIIFMNNGYLTYVEPLMSEESINEMAQSVIEFDEYLSEQGIPLIYANAGSKVCPYNKKITITSVENSNENGNALMTALNNAGIDTIDFRDEMIKYNLDWYDSYYKYDHHWTTKTSLWAAGVIASKLNNDYGFNFDKTLFTSESYKIQHYTNCWLGCEGREVTLSNTDLDDYDLILPKFNTNFSISIPTQNIELSGDYQHALFNYDKFMETTKYSGSDYLNKPDMFSCAMISNQAITRIRNNLATHNPGKKILMIQDSFCWYTTSYLISDIDNIDAIHLMNFDGSVKSYIEKEKPDLVIVMYCERLIRPINWNDHISTFDFR